jgi:inositol transport system ATP-binding protein
LGTQQEYVVQIEHLCKRFPGVVALDDFSLDLRPGQVHALVGENGAGKSTVMKILAGILKPNEGRILFRGQPFEAKSAFDAIAKGITMIPQELDLVPDLTVAMNIFLGNEVMARGGLMQNRRMAERARKMLKDFDLDIEPTKKVSELSVAQMQMVAILKATAFDATVIIMDEPTSAITDREVEKLFQVIARLRGQGKAIIYISHKMDEIFRIADYVTVMRDGRLVGSGPIQDFTRDEIIRMMVGRELTDMFVKDAKPTGAFNPEEVILEVDGWPGNTNFRTSPSP